MKERLSVIIPVYNMSKGLSKTLKSLSYNTCKEHMEVIVVDGGSTDGIDKVVLSFKHLIDIFISEKDDGQYHAIKKGINLSSGSIITWLNADDVYFPWTASVVLETFDRYQDIHWISGRSTYSFEGHEWIHVGTANPARPQRLVASGCYREGVLGFLQQESMFFRRNLWQISGGLDTKLNLAADYKLWIDFSKISNIVSLDLPLAAFKQTDLSRSKQHKKIYMSEVDNIFNDINKLKVLTKWLLLNFGPLLRILLWFKVDYISYSRKHQRVHRRRGFRPLRSESFGTLVSDWTSKITN